MIVRSFLGMFVAVVFFALPKVEAQDSRCADCHFANPQSDPAANHLYDWERSAHGRQGVGCEKCHGGDPTSFESFIAHRGILTSRNPASPVHRSNLPSTCGGCHIGQFVDFQDSRHHELLRSGADDGPTCVTCHGPVAARLLSPRALEKRCATCHGPEGVHPNSDYPPDARLLLEEVLAVRELLSNAPDLIERVEDDERRGRLEYSYEQAQVPLIEAVESAHSFVFERVRERLADAKERAEGLLRDLANPE